MKVCKGVGRAEDKSVAKGTPENTSSITKGVAKKDKRYGDALCGLAAWLTLGLSHLLTNRAISFEKDFE